MDVVILNTALWRFNQTILLDNVWNTCVQNKARPHIIVVGSTIDRLKNGKPSLYATEKKALRDYCNTLGLASVGGGGEKGNPKLTLYSIGLLENSPRIGVGIGKDQYLSLMEAAEYIKWLIEQPRHININEISVDPLQDEQWWNE